MTRANRGALRPSSIRKSVKKKKADSTTGGGGQQEVQTSLGAGLHTDRVVRLWHPLDVGKKKRIRDGHPECLGAGCPVRYNSPLHF